jgi:hypothetical protein
LTQSPALICSLSEARRRQSIKELTENLEGEIRNPLKGIPKAQLLENVTRWHAEKGLGSDVLPLLKKGALVAQNPAQFEDIAELSEDEKESLRREITHRWSHPWPLYYTIILNSIAAAIQGWDQTGSNGANLSFPTALGISDSPPTCGPVSNAGTCAKNSWIIGFVNAMPYITIALL